MRYNEVGYKGKGSSIVERVYRGVVGEIRADPARTTPICVKIDDDGLITVGLRRRDGKF
jgi:hypothetical protein